MSGHKDCPACGEVVEFDASDKTVPTGEYLCSGNTGCAREERIKAAREAVLEEADRWRDLTQTWRETEGDSALRFAIDAWRAARAEGGER